ncbi:MAG: ribosome biogenesis GTPase YlqF [Candidatus Faecivivens sp.]|nr:ribosome biogenesis GTPase YlqF [Oscillospiraceae bacterium]MDY2712549.1 ribosome biogenesis GTPase YlqF [Candidatus Faecivivens sp.]
MNLEQIPSIQWFPGHMAKTRRLMKANLPYVDIVIELRDAKIPLSSGNPELQSMLGNKKRIVLLNKCDTADPKVTAAWIDWFKEQGIAALAVDSRSGKGLENFLPLVRSELSDLLSRWAEKGAGGRPIRMMVVGIPNVGKSSFINRMAGSKRARVEDRPGVTRDKQWVTVSKDVDLLDMPGVLWPKFEDPAVGERLAITGAVKDQILDLELLAMRLLSWLRDDYPELLSRYKISPEEAEGLEPFDLLELVGRKRGMLISGGEVNTERAAVTVLDEYRAGKLGRLSLELPPEK